MNISRAGHWQMLALLYRHGTSIKALNAAVSKWGPKKLEHYVKCHRLGSHRRIHQNVYGVDGVSSWMGEMRLRRSFATHSQSGRHKPLLTKKRKAMQCLSLWLAHTHNTQKAQRTATQKRKMGRQSKNYCPVDHGPLLSKVMLFLSQEEEHPSPSSSSQPDYSEIYRYLSQVLAGQEPTQLSQGSAVKVLEMIKRVQRVASSSQDLKKLRHHLRQNLTSCLMPWMKKPNCSPSTTSQEEGCNSNIEECPLFQEVDDEEELGQWRKDIKTQGYNDPHYEMKKEKLMKNYKEKQAVVSSSISNMPGLNPFLLPPHLLFKVEDDTMNALLKS